MEIILASASPRRKEILSRSGIQFSVMVSEADENIDFSLPPYFVAEQLSLLKASAVAKDVKSHSLVIGADTIVVLDDTILTKPKDTRDAKVMLSALSGRWHSVITGVTVIDTKTAKSETFYAQTKVHFLSLSDEEIDNYILTSEPMDKAGAYGIQGKGGLFVDEIQGDYNNVVGLPLCKLFKVLKDEFGVTL